MPYKDTNAAKLSNRERQRRYRARQKAKRAAAVPAVVPSPPADPAAAIAQWSRETLRVPFGHPLAGSPMELPDFGVRFLRDALAPGVRESLLCVGRKNAKSAIVAVAVLAYLVGPLRQPGWRCGVVSVTKEKAGELKAQIQGIAEASNLSGLTFRRSPTPGRVESETGSVDFLAADASSGHASGFDLSIVDELGLLHERDRALVNGMRTAVSARDGRFLALSIQGGAPFTKEMLDRRDDPACVVHHYAAPEGCKLDDPAAWDAANPGISAGIKSISYMRDESRRVLASPADQADFRAHDLNQPGEPGREMIVTAEQWQACIVETLPERAGPCAVGIDLGGSSSMTAGAAFWPNTGRLESWGAFPGVPDLHARGQRDGVGRRYALMQDRGELVVYPGVKTTPVRLFLEDVIAILAGASVKAVLADRYRQSEAEDAYREAGCRWRQIYRGMGWRDGSEDILHFQRAVIGGRIATTRNLLLESAILESALARDPANNAKIDKSRSRGRIDALSATVLAVGEGMRIASRPPRRPLRSALAG